MHRRLPNLCVIFSLPIVADRNAPALFTSDLSRDCSPSWQTPWNPTPSWWGRSHLHYLWKFLQMSSAPGLLVQQLNFQIQFIQLDIPVRQLLCRSFRSLTHGLYVTSDVLSSSVEPFLRGGPVRATDWINCRVKASASSVTSSLFSAFS